MDTDMTVFLIRVNLCPSVVRITWCWDRRVELMNETFELRMFAAFK